jgi:hypothetical protein
MTWDSAASLWTHLDSKATNVLTNAERCAALTLPHILLPDGEKPDDQTVTLDMQSLGAQAVNHLANKMMLAMFAPSRPTFRLELGKTTLSKIAADQSTASKYTDILAQSERDAIKALDSSGQRHKLHNLMLQLIVTGNTLLITDPDDLRVMSVRYWRVKRTIKGRMKTLIIKERICFDELDEDVQNAVPSRARGRGFGFEDEVDFYVVVDLMPGGKRYEITQWVDNVKLPSEFTSTVKVEDCPYVPLTWRLSDDANYGTSHVLDYIRDFEALSTVAESLVDGTVQTLEFRWMISPSLGSAAAEDLRKSVNGDTVSGNKDDITVLNGGNPLAVREALTVAQAWEQRLARAFLLQSAVTRQAERVTAEEIRLTAQELETSLGGVYSFLAATMQLPIAVWSLTKAGYKLKDADIEISVVTGMDSLSRLGDLDRLTQALGVLANVNNLPQGLQLRLKMDALTTDVGAAVGLDMKKYLKSDAEVSQEQQNQQLDAINANTAMAAGEAAVQGPR